TIGAVWQPSFVPSLRLSLDYYDIKIDKTINSPSLADVMNGCYDKALNPTLAFNDSCKAIQRSAANGALNGVDAKGVIRPSTNAGTERGSGVEIAGNYRVELSAFGWRDTGRLDLSVNVSILTKQEPQATRASGLRDCVGYYSVSCGEPKVKQGWN